eukprot:6264901-Prymnesium_polylepis.1
MAVAPRDSNRQRIVATCGKTPIMDSRVPPDTGPEPGNTALTTTLECASTPNHPVTGLDGVTQSTPEPPCTDAHATPSLPNLHCIARSATPVPDTVTMVPPVRGPFHGTIPVTET